MERLKRTLKELTELHGAPGFETDVTGYIIKEVEQLDYLKYKIDTIGNLYIKIPGTDPDGHIIHLDAHIDEPCFIVKYIDDNGYIYVAPLGLIAQNIMMGQRVIIKTNNKFVRGCFGVKSYHLSSMSDKSITMNYDDIWIDVGCSSKEGVYNLGIREGFPVMFDVKFEELANNNVMSKAFDNRSGCAVLLEVIKKLENIEAYPTIYITFSVQEELILRGSRVIFNGFRKFYGRVPDLSIVYDICLCGDTPFITKNKAPIELGKGLGIKLYDKSSVSHYAHIVPRKIIDFIENNCRMLNIPFQYDFLAGCTNADLFALEDIGILTGGISIPCRYTHSPVEVVNLIDIYNAIDLTLNIIENFEKFF